MVYTWTAPNSWEMVAKPGKPDLDNDASTLCWNVAVFYWRATDIAKPIGK
jgi:hypothetical protein